LRLGLVAEEIDADLVDILLQNILPDLRAIFLCELDGIVQRDRNRFDVKRLNRLYSCVPDIIVRPADG
jgi:hypothetical protein